LPRPPVTDQGLGNWTDATFRVFINYRRDDTPGHAGRLYDALSAHFGDDSVFMDVDKIDPGVDFKRAINQGVAGCDALIAVIGREWLTIKDSAGRRRLDNPDDYVRLEIEAALRRGVRVIPALVEDTEMPSSRDLPETMADLALRNSTELGDGTRWRDDVRRLIAALDRIRESQVHARPTPETEPGAMRDVDDRPTGPPPPPAARRRGWPRRRILVLAAMAAIVWLAIGAVFLFRGGDWSGHKTESTAAGMDIGFPDAIEANLLLAHIPDKIRSSCRRGEDAARGTFLRSLACAQGGGHGLVIYSRAHSSDALRAHLLQRIMDVNLKYPTRWSCRERQPAADEWRREGLQTHLEEPSHQAEGRVLCYRDGARAHIVWTDTPTKILAEASRPAAQWGAFYAWWRTVAGPERGLGMGGGMGMPANTSYPDAIEKELLLDHIPPSIRKSCERTRDFNPDVFLRAVACSQGVKGADVVYMYAHSATAMMGHANDRINAAGLNYPTAASCANATEAADTWLRSGDIHHMETRFSPRASGRVLCYVGGGRAFIEWTDNPTGIYAVASRPSSARRALYAWWMDRAGPGALEGSGGMEHKP
jgi:hypothetical protein